MLLMLLLGISAVSASENITDLKNNTYFSDNVVENLSDVESGIDDVNQTNDENDTQSVNYTLSGSDVSGYSFNSLKYSFSLLDGQGKPICDEIVTLKISGKYYYQSTDKNGTGHFDLSLKPGKYAVTAQYKDISINNTINVLSLKVTAKDISSTYGTKVNYVVCVLNSLNKPVRGVAVTVTVGNKVYKIKTDSKGVAKLTLNNKAGKYKITYYAGDVSGKNTYVVKNKITLSILKWGIKGDVSKVALIKKNMPNNVWFKKAVAATKKGIPLLKFKGGSGKTVFITAGVHGNELSSQVAAMKLIKYMTDNPIKGTVYIMPFVNVKAISQKVRYTDYDFNRAAGKTGTVPNKIVKLVVKYKCDSYGDFHTTQPYGIPGKNVVMGSKTPNLISYKTTNFIAKQCNVNKIVYSYAGKVYPGAIADNVNNKGIASVLCEVMLPHNTVTAKTVSLSLPMMNSLLKYNSVI